MMSFHLYCLRILCLLVFLASLNVIPVKAEEGPRLSYIQGLIGAADFDKDRMTFAEPATNDSEAFSTDDLSTMPYLGIAGQFALGEAASHIGIDTSLLFGWRSDDTKVYAGDGKARIKIDSDLWLIDVAIGLYAQTMMGDRWRLYAAAGPMMLFGEYSDDKKQDEPTVDPLVETDGSSSDSEFGVGGYARLGLEYRLYNDAFMGIAVRGITTNLEFDRAIEDGGLAGVQGFVTFTRAY